MHGRRLAPDEQRPEEASKLRAARARNEAAERMLALQRSAGNQAVNAMLARTPDDKKPQERKGSETVTLPDIGTIEVTSVGIGQLANPGLGRGGGAGDKDKQSAVREITLSSHVGKHSAELQRALIDGKQMDVEVVMQRSGGVFRLKLKAAIVSSYSTSGEDESWVLNFGAIEQTTEAEGPKEGG